MAAANPETKIAEAAFRALAKTRWNALKLADVAKAAKMPLASLLREIPNKSVLIGPLLRLTVDDALRHYKPERGSSNARDRIFDVTLNWFEALALRKAAVRSLYEGLKRDPLTLIAAREEIHAAASTLLALAEGDDGRADLKAAGLALAIARAIPAWLEDDKHLSKTMASLDGDFGRAEDFAKRFTGKAKKTKRAGG
jgi:AcrR family transcriptional regulator